MIGNVIPLTESCLSYHLYSILDRGEVMDPILREYEHHRARENASKSEYELDAARYRWLREQVRANPVLAQALFWNNSSRGEFDKAVDAAMKTAPEGAAPKA
jgi:hypothetical protein